MNLSDNENDDSSGLRHLSNQPYTLKLCIFGMPPSIPSDLCLNKKSEAA
jgi:hypothetical protein